MMRVRIDITGMKKVQQALKKMQRLVPKELGQYMYEEVQEVMKVSQLEVPIDTGALKSSGYVDKPKYRRNKSHVRIGYGGRAAKINPKTKKSTTTYAIFVHEIPKNYRVGKSKYLIDPARDRSKNMPNNIVKKYKTRSRSRNMR